MNTPRREPQQDLLKFCCSRCADCCRLPVVAVTHHDLRRLLRVTSGSPLRWVKFYGDWEMEDGDADPSWITLSYGRVLLGLRKRAHRCIFLTPEGSCRVYGNHPMACRSFPLQPEKPGSGGTEVVRFRPTVQEGWVSCRGVLQGPANTEWLRILHREQEELHSYRQKVEQWNAQGFHGTKAEFLASLGL